MRAGYDACLLPLIAMPHDACNGRRACTAVPPTSCASLIHLPTLSTRPPAAPHSQLVGGACWSLRTLAAACWPRLHLLTFIFMFVLCCAHMPLRYGSHVVCASHGRQVSQTKWASRWDAYLRMPGGKVHWCVTLPAAEAAAEPMYKRVRLCSSPDICAHTREFARRPHLQV